jgi:APA family basic amino acid/polyamine antiporter
MARRRAQGLERVLGTPALFSTAYGDVGSSIYYALGLTASFALGLTPVVFIIAGLFFVCTAATYAEGTVRFPEAGGSSSFARHAFNEVVSFGAGWAQLLNYMVTISISAFFVPHYLSVFWGPLRENPWDIVGGAVVILTLVSLNVFGIREAVRLNVVLAVVDFSTQVMHPVELRESVTSPGGTTIAAIRELEQAGVRAAFLNAIQAAMTRSRELAQGG